MGYCYSNGKLCCDICGEPGARKSKCPHGYCPAVACCTRPECKAKLKQSRKEHCDVHCKPAHAAFVAQQGRTAARLAAGEWLRCAAVTMYPRDCVEVTFKNAAGERIDRYMSHELYDWFPLGIDVSIEQYAKVGRVEMEPFDASTPATLNATTYVTVGELQEGGATIGKTILLNAGTEVVDTGIRADRPAAALVRVRGNYPEEGPARHWRHAWVPASILEPVGEMRRECCR